MSSPVWFNFILSTYIWLQFNFSSFLTYIDDHLSVWLQFIVHMYMTVLGLSFNLVCICMLFDQCMYRIIFSLTSIHFIYECLLHMIWYHTYRYLYHNIGVRSAYIHESGVVIFQFMRIQPCPPLWFDLDQQRYLIWYRCPSVHAYKSQFM